jgi:hypothetical protein
MFWYTTNCGVYMKINRLAYLFLGGLSIAQVMLALVIPLSPFTILLAGSGLGGLFALWQSCCEFTKQKIEHLELLLKESRQSTEFWRSECLKLEKLYGATIASYNEYYIKFNSLLHIVQHQSTDPFLRQFSLDLFEELHEIHGFSTLEEAIK